MLKSIITFLAILCTLNSFAQINYQQGYFINDKNDKIECLIKNIDWKNNPTKFQYKISENATSQTATIESVKEFGIDNFSKYQRFDVEMDRSSKELENMSISRDPKFKKEQLFLKTLVEGNATLFFYQEKNLKRYFIKTVDAEIEQLVFKKFKTSKNQVKENRQFLVQLRDQLQCDSTISNEKLRKLEYKKKPLVKIFEEYNQCANTQFINYEKLQKRDLFNLNLKPGIQASTLNMRLGGRNFDSGTEVGFRFGIELEFILPINKNKWAIFTEPSFQYQKSESTTEVISVVTGTAITTSTIFSDYKSFELPLGFRHYFFLNPNSKIFATAAYVLDFNFASKASDGGGLETPYNRGRNLAFGVGYNYKKKYSLEIRHGLRRDLHIFYRNATSKYKTVSLIFGYTIL